MTKVEPISPQDVFALKKEFLPAEVILAFNEMIIENFDGRQSYFLQKDVVSLIKKKMSMALKDERMIYQKHWLDVEDIFKQKGWHVEYDEPVYNETYSASFTFVARPNPKRG